MLGCGFPASVLPLAAVGVSFSQHFGLSGWVLPLTTSPTRQRKRSPPSNAIGSSSWNRYADHCTESIALPAAVPAVRQERI
eukprot:SAG11_NODE_1491_length_4810_cov_1.999363_6_plen_81_part_00